MRIAQIFIMEQVHSVQMDIGGREFKLTSGLYAFQAHGAVVASFGETQVLGATTMAEKAKEGIDFFPLSVDYEERYYATGKIKGSRFIKREGRPSEQAILASRMTDRPIRPLFPKGAMNDVQCIATVLSADMEVSPTTTATNAISAALMVSGIPFAGPVGSIRMGLVDNQLIVNPTYEQVEQGGLDLVVAGTLDAITMVEAGAHEVPEDVMLEALAKAHEVIKQICELQIQLRDKVNPTPRVFTIRQKNEAAANAVQSYVTEDMLLGVNGNTKFDVKGKIHALEDALYEKYAPQIEAGEFGKGDLADALNSLLEKDMRKNILQQERRIDGRSLDQIRPIECRVGEIPRTHGSGMFQRGETQVLTLTTLGGPGAAQIIDTMDTDEERRYMHHYNFPPYSVGEVRMMRGTSRREVGHGDLAERALLPVLPKKEDFAYTMRLVSEVLSCNGSSSMASVCGSTLSLMDAGVPISRPVSGIAMGLVTGEDFDGKNGTYKILTDIQGLEDFAGDMDFKVTGTSEGITALQMDIKVKGLSLDVLKEALERARNARNQVLEAMLKAIATPRDHLSKYAPMISSMHIDPDDIKLVIGKGGETIQKITAETECEIDIEQDGLVMITAKDQESGQRAMDWIKKITYKPAVGDVFEGKVVRIMDFGAFVEITPGKDGLVHISQLDHHRVNRVEDVVQLGDIVKVKLMEIDDQGRYNLSRKVLLPRPEGMPEQSESDFGGGYRLGGAGRPSRPPRRGPPRR